jgi:hypothetical protein
VLRFRCQDGLPGQLPRDTSAHEDAQDLSAASCTVPRKRTHLHACTIEDVNRDGRADLLCHFQNVPTNWQTGQTLVTLAGKLNNGESIFASDKILLVP